MAKIMVVDDSAVMRRNIKFILTNAGHEVIAEASNGKEACQLYAKMQPEVVTMDISMPEMDGIEAVKHIVRDFPDASIVMVTTLSQRNKVYEAVKSGAKNYITKPIDADKLMEIINEIAGTLAGQSSL